MVFNNLCLYSVSECISNGIIEHLFPVHENKTLKWLRIAWVKSFFSLQPLDKVCDYFGVKIAMYFAWIGHYTNSLIYPAVVYSAFWASNFIAKENLTMKLIV